LSKEIFGFPEDDLMRLKQFVNATYNRQLFSIDDQREIIALMKFDKKNIGNNINFVLLEEIGHPRLDCKVDNELIYKAFEYYLS
jgi:3-dehydroquinate synthase